MTTIIVIGHGKFASGITEGLNLILGKQDNYYAIDYNEDLNSGMLRKKIKNIVEKCNDQVLILCDLISGTPFNISMELAIKNEKIRLIYGINLSMLIEIVSKRNFSEDEIDYDEIINIGKESMGIFSIEDLYDDE